MNYIINKTKLAARSLAAIVTLGLSITSLSANEIVVPHSEYGTGWEFFIMGDTTTTGEQNHDVYILESDKVYLQQVQLNLYHSVELRGDDDGFPAIIQPTIGQEGHYQLGDTWPSSSIYTHGEGQVYKFHNLLFNGLSEQLDFATFGVIAAYGENNEIIVDHVTSLKNTTITFMSFGDMLSWTLTNNTAVQYTSYFGGMWFGGFLWGGGSWVGGPIKKLIAQNNTIEGTWGEPFVLYNNIELAEIDHNTIVNASTEISFFRFGNNTLFSNNLFVNMNATPQTRNPNSNINLVQGGRMHGHGKMVQLYQEECTDSELIDDGNCWDNNNRNIIYENNAWYDTPELLTLYEYGDWCWEVSEPIYDDDGYQIDEEIVTVCDTTLAVADQSKWVGDSTIAQFVNGISESNNIHATDLEFNLESGFFNAFTDRIGNYFEDGPGHDGSYLESYSYPDIWMYSHAFPAQSLSYILNFGYSESSSAFNHAEDGFPVGNLNVFPDKKAEWLNEQGPSHVFISEVAEGTGSNKYIEIYNGTGADIDLSEYSLSSCSNGCDEEGVFDYPNNVTFESGTIVAAGDVYVVAHPSADEAILAHADFTGFVYLSNGDDFFALTRVSSGEVVDKVGDFGADPGSGWDVAGVGAATKDHTLVRRHWVDQGNEDWAESAGISAHETEWIVLEKDNWSYLGSHTRNEVDAFQLVGTWKMAPIMGAMKVGPYPDDGGWWSSSEGDIEARACFFDDWYLFNADGSFQNVLGTETWLETWQDGVTAEGCGAPVAPHDGSIAATFTHDIGENKLTLNGDGAFLGIAKAITGGELSNDGTEIPASRTYDLYPAYEPNMMNLVISTGGGYWTFKMVNSEWTPAPIPSIDITFNLDMSEAGTINPDGVSIAGGTLFGGPGDNVMTDENGDGIYSITITRPQFEGSHYTFLNGVSDWNQKEDIGGQDCADEGNWNDRFLEWGDEDIVVNACFGLCGEGTCRLIQSVVFTKDDYADPSLPENQDIITDDVKLTRGDRGWLYNAAAEGGHDDNSPAGTRWAFGPTELQPMGGMTYGSMRTVVTNSIGGFTEISGKTFSMHIVGTDMFYDITFNSWTQGQNGGGFEYSRAEAGVPSIGFTSYSLSLELVGSDGSSELPAYNVDGDGLMVHVEFEVGENSMGPFVGALGVFWDANFNNVLDDGDVNVVNMGDPTDPFDMNSNEASVLLIADDSPEDMDSEVGKYKAHLHDLDFLYTQGATFFFVEVAGDGVVGDSPLAVQPFSGANDRFSGSAMLDDDAEVVSGVFVDLVLLTEYTDDYDGSTYYDHEDVAFGVTNGGGDYDIGSTEIAEGDSVEISSGISGSERRLFSLIENTDGGYSEFTGFNVVGGTSYVSNIAVIEHNTLVQGYALDDMGNPLPPGVIYGLTVFDEGFSVWNIYHTGEDGYYNFWSTNGQQVWVYYFAPNMPWIFDNFYLDATENDENLDAFVYNYNITQPEQTAFVEGYAYYREWNNDAEEEMIYLQGVEVNIYNDQDLFIVTTDENGYFGIDVPASNDGVYYQISAEDTIPGFTSYEWYTEEYFYTGGQYTYDIEYYPYEEYFTISGYVYDDMGSPVYDAGIDIMEVNEDSSYYNYWYDWESTDENGYFSITAPSGFYNILVYAYGFENEWSYDIELIDDMELDFTLTPLVFTGSAQGVVSFIGEYDPGNAYINVYNELYDAYTETDENGFYSIELIDGVYDIYVNADGYGSFYMPEAFEIAGNTVNFDIELFEYGYAGPPHIVNLHDVPNDQGRQMRAVWDAGMPGDWGHFTQFSIWRKVVNAPIELWDYIETVPWHGMDSYAAVVPTLGDSSMHEMHMSTFMVTAHTEDVTFWLDSEPMSGYSIDNLHPEAPMSLSFATGPGSVSLNWSGPIDEDFNYFNVYRQDILTNEPAMVFTTTDSFYVDQAMEDVGAYEYWVTAVDLSGLESDASGIVSAVLSSEDEVGMPTEFALKQNYPNPFNPSTQIQYALPSESRVVISIYDLTGRKVRTLVNEVQSAGHRSVMWNATNEIGRQVSAGMYIYSIQAGDFIQNRKMVLMK